MHVWLSCGFGGICAASLERYFFHILSDGSESIAFTNITASKWFCCILGRDNPANVILIALVTVAVAELAPAEELSLTSSLSVMNQKLAGKKPVLFIEIQGRIGCCILIKSLNTQCFVLAIQLFSLRPHSYYNRNVGSYSADHIKTSLYRAGITCWTLKKGKERRSLDVPARWSLATCSKPSETSLGLFTKIFLHSSSLSIPSSFF